MPSQEGLEIRSHGDFWSQVPVVLFTIAAVVAIVLVNARTRAEVLEPPAAQAVEILLDPVDCADCGEVIAVRAEPAEAGVERSVPGAVLLDVRMIDGSVRTVRQFAPGFDVGDRVQVNGNALIARG